MGTSETSVPTASSRNETSTRFSLSADGCPKGSPSEQPPVRKAAITNKTESFLIIVRFAVSQPVEIRFDAPSDRNVDDPVAV